MPVVMPGTEEQLEQLLLHHKYHTAVRRVARGVAHSYNNIFTGLGGQATMLLQEAALPTTPDDKRGGLINELLQRGIEQTEVLYNFTRDDSGERGPQSPLLVAGKAVDLLNTVSRLHRFHLHCETTREKIVGQVRDLVLLLFYLGENGVDATPEGGEIHVTVTSPGQHQVVFTFADKGPGFAPVQAEAFGKPFNTHQAPDSWRGLGLYAATILAARHGGTLASRREGNLTLVSATFPQLIEKQPPLPADTTARRLKPQSLPRQCFLVVEDDEAMRTLLLNRLQRRGHMVFCVDTCAEAVEEFLHLHDIITTVLMDVGLRDDSGYECCRRLLAISSQARVVFMSGEHEPPRESRPHDFIFLQKPFTMDQLERAIIDVHL